MLFKDVLNNKTSELQPEFDRLFDDILKNQTHDGDLLLIRLNGFYNPDVHKWTNLPEKLSPYMIGPNNEGHSDYLHYEFIHSYRKKGIIDLNHPEYLKQHEWSSDRKKEIDQLVAHESMTIQLEMLIYLKIWEADFFIKKLYQLTRLVLGEPYDWHFRVSESNRDKEATGTREKIIRKLIRDKLEKKYPIIYKAIKNAYRTQIRNSIAHSQYSFLGRNISPNNFIEKDPASQLKSLSFDDWNDLFHDTMVIYNLVIRLFNQVDKLYQKVALENGLLMEVRVSRIDPQERIEYFLLKYRPEWKDWNWKSKDE
jgi:hypothetical protein